MVKILGFAVAALSLACLCLFFRLKKLKEAWARKLKEAREEIQEEYSERMVNREAKIFALQSQINPHFLYNTLECIRSEALLYECDSIAKMAKALALFFRYSISKKETLVTVRDELANIENYFLIQSYRFDNKFSFEVKVDGQDREIYGCLIPKLSLQPLVENAIFHGLETQPGAGKITIRMELAGDKALITVSDNGVGMEREKLEQIQLRLLGAAGDCGKEGAGNGGGSGIALTNVCQRIKLIFGNDYGLNVYSTPDVGTDVELVLPAKKQGDAYGA